MIIDAVQKAASESKRGRRRVARVEDHLPTEEDETQRRLQVENRILGSLSFAFIAARYIQVAKAHASTFEWMFKDESLKDQHSHSFTHWLEFGDGIYWIDGKAGSGKSTLMKFLYDHAQTQRLLTSWVNPIRLDLANFFFWNSGTTDQNHRVAFCDPCCMRSSPNIELLYQSSCRVFGETNASSRLSSIRISNGVLRR